MPIHNIIPNIIIKASFWSRNDGSPQPIKASVLYFCSFIKF